MPTRSRAIRMRVRIVVCYRALARRLEGRLGALARRLEGRLGALTRRLERRLGLLSARRTSVRRTSVGRFLAITHPPNCAGDLFGVQDVGPEAHLVLPGFGRYPEPHLFFQNVVNVETQLGLCQWTCVGRVPDDHGLRRDLRALRVGGSEQYQETFLPVLVDQPQNCLLGSEVHGSRCRSDEALGGREHYLAAGRLGTCGDRGPRHAVAFTEGDNELAVEHWRHHLLYPIARALERPGRAPFQGSAGPLKDRRSLIPLQQDPPT